MTERLRTRQIGSGTYGRTHLTFATCSLPANGSVVDTFFFIADQRYRVVAIEEAHHTNSTSGTLQVRRCQGTEAPAAGDALLASTIDLSANANTTQVGTLTATQANLVLEAGDRLSVDFGGTLTSLAGFHCTVVLVPLDSLQYYVSP